MQHDPDAAFRSWMVTPSVVWQFHDANGGAATSVTISCGRYIFVSASGSPGEMGSMEEPQEAEKPKQWRGKMKRRLGTAGKIHARTGAAIHDAVIRGICGQSQITNRHPKEM